MSDSGAYPSVDACVLVVVKAVAARRDRHRAAAVHDTLTASAIAERVTGITLPPRRGRDGWWLVGRVLDELEDAEFSVWYLPASRRIGLSRRERPVSIAPAPPVDSPYYYDGLRRKWIDAATGEIIADPRAAEAVAPGQVRQSGRDHESRSRAAT